MDIQSNKYFHEITRLTEKDTFLVFDRIKDNFEFPLHYHKEYELNYIKNGKGARRILGNHISEIDEYELVFIGPHQTHTWEAHNSKEKDVREITIQFHNNLFENSFLSRKVMSPICEMLKKSAHGILFSYKTIMDIAPRIEALSKLEGIDSLLELISILNFLANSNNQKLLSDHTPNMKLFEEDIKMKKINEFIRENYSRKIMLEEVAELISTSNPSLNRFIKKKTGLTFVNYLNKIRIENASRLLIEKDFNTSEAAYLSGFNNISNFNRIFKQVKKVTPSDFRKKYKGLTKFL